MTGFLEFGLILLAFLTPLAVFGLLAFFSSSGGDRK